MRPKFCPTTKNLISSLPFFNIARVRVQTLDLFVFSIKTQRPLSVLHLLSSSGQGDANGRSLVDLGAVVDAAAGQDDSNVGHSRDLKKKR